MELFPQSWDVRAHLGETYDALGRTEKAARAFGMARTLNPRRTEYVNEKLRELEKTKDGSE